MKLKRASIFSKIVILAVIVYAVVLLVNTQNQVTMAERDRDVLQEKVDTMVQQNAELKYDIEHAGDPEIIAEIARGKLGLVKPGERIFYDVRN